MNESAYWNGRIRIGLDNKSIDLNSHSSHKSLGIHYPSNQSLQIKTIISPFDDERFLRNFSLNGNEASM